ncbi:hypothetical protein M527_18435 [Sphingobium indicum IP26]|uniref:Uncharacterized protein n=1 Tax=Sphingobium indicum F2 TaxID=1450518 RepID=A0A8E1C1Y0_9SPHN|nr:MULTISPECIES: hypothetical protein [Sphingobium]EPR17050.1 hypothetical protein M527_18435 [Sphingobium indicum IP26]EQB04280.1 hypothetical protein L286_10750 [Sphingobium sp. HDIP04]KER35574.1 hypothetical protein AL00_15230 [Sphingobium indicum F2]
MRGLAKALLGALGAGLLLFSLPVGLVETVVASSGLSEAVPAAAPPLGLKARLLLAGFGAAMALGLIWAGQREKRVALLTHDKQGRGNGAAGVSEMGFALSKLNWLSRDRRKSGPALRRADAHPDAPARSPIFASRDFGGLDIFARTAPGREDGKAQAPVEAPASVPGGLSIPGAPERLPEETAFARLQRAFAPETADAEPQQAAQPARSERTSAPTAHLSLSELTQRLEQGLAQRKRMGRPASVLADMPVEPAVPVRDQVEQGVDEALRAALGTLRTMAGRAR